MKKIILGAAALSIALSMFSCKKETPNVVQNTTQIGAIFENNRASNTQNFTIPSAGVQTIQGNKGTVIRFYPNMFVDAAGAPVSGSIDIELLEVLDKPGMIFNRAVTESGQQLLISGGELNLKVSQNGVALQLANASNGPEIYVPTTSPDPQMDIFFGAEVEGDLDWSLIDSTGIDIVSGDSLNWQDSSFVWDGGNYYNFNFNNQDLGWINCDFFWDNPNPQITVNAQPSDAKFTHENTAFFIVYDNYNSVGSMSDWDQDGVFSQGNIPVNLDITIVGISEINGQLYYGEVMATTVDDQVYSVTLNPVTQTELEDLVNAL